MPAVSPQPLATVPLNVPLTAPPTPVPTARPSPSPSPGVTLAGPGNPQTAPLVIDPNAKLAVRESKDGYVVALGDNLTLDLVALPGGEFMMGAAKSEYDDERPVHRVRVSPFNIGRYEVTQAQWQAVMGGKNPSNFNGTDRPVEQVSWDDAVEFCKRLSQMTGVQFRLPTEAEWEYAARAGTTTEYSFGDDERQLGVYAWFGNNSGNQTHPVGKKLPNRFGLYDMYGNVLEWCQDWYDENYYAQLQKAQGVAVNPQGSGSGKYRVLRGGAWYGISSFCRSAIRSSVFVTPGIRDDSFGFRVVLSARTQ